MVFKEPCENAVNGRIKSEIMKQNRARVIAKWFVAKFNKNAFEIKKILDPVLMAPPAV
jgi:hypothetical protein